MQADYILVAAGGITLPQLNCMIFATSDEMAIADATKMVAPLSIGGYFSFTLYTVKGQHKRVCDFRAITPAVQVEVRK